MLRYGCFLLLQYFVFINVEIHMTSYPVVSQGSELQILVSSRTMYNHHRLPPGCPVLCLNICGVQCRPMEYIHC